VCARVYVCVCVCMHICCVCVGISGNTEDISWLQIRSDMHNHVSKTHGGGHSRNSIDMGE
jgi:hypothetical protein